MGLIKSIRNIELSNTQASSNITDKKLATLSVRESGFMSMAVFEKTIELVKGFVDVGTQGELTLSGLGDSKLNPEFEKMIAYVKKVMPTLNSDVREDGNSYGIILNPIKWAVDSDIPDPKYNAGPCPWIASGEVMIGYNGDVHNCFLDAKGESSKLNIMKDDIVKYDVQHFNLCDRCCFEKG